MKQSAATSMMTGRLITALPQKPQGRSSYLENSPDIRRKD
jgi:hypothetical protein